MTWSAGSRDSRLSAARPPDEQSWAHKEDVLERQLLADSCRQGLTDGSPILRKSTRGIAFATLRQFDRPSLGSPRLYRA